MFLLADCGLGAVWMRRSEELPKGSILLTSVASHGYVLLFVDGFKLSMEAADNHILEAVGLNACPICDFIRWNILHIAGHIVACVGITSFRSDARHELVIFIRDVISGGKLRH